MRWSLILASLFAGASAATAAGPYDGTWTGTAPEAGDCGVATVQMTIADNQITGTLSGKHGSATIKPAAIGADGTAQVTYDGPMAAFGGAVRFSGDRFAGTFDTFCGTRAVTGSRR